MFGLAPEIEREFPGLADRGILPLSTSDPYLASNAFIAKEAETSAYLHNFLKTRGGPMAIEISDSYTSFPHMVMFYPRSRQVYAAERVSRKVPGQIAPVREWMVRGPYAIERKDYRELAELDSSMVGEPVFMLRGREVRFTQERPVSPTPEKVLIPVLPPMPQPTPTPVKKRLPPKAPIIKVQGEPAITEGEWKPLNSDQQALLMAQGFAERAENGDLWHVVKGDSETLELIAKWYAEPSAVDEIARVNGLVAGQALLAGTKVRVPLKLLKKLKVMPVEIMALRP